MHEAGITLPRALPQKLGITLLLTSMSTIFGKSGKTFSPVVSNDLHDVLPAANFNIKKSMQGMLYLEQIADFTLPKKLYATNNGYAERILNTFLDRGTATGVILAGEKGSGKSLLAKTLSVNAAKVGIPTIVINAPWCGEAFNQFLQDIEQPTVILFDEFEKIYSREEQEAVLTLLDGVYPSNKLYIFTCNDKYRIDSHMRNRPGRIYYAIDYAGLETEFIREYCVDNLVNQAEIDSVLKISSIFANFNFDMLRCLVEEMNRYKEPAFVAIKLLNIKAEYDSICSYTLEFEHPSHKVKSLHNTVWKGNPLIQGVQVEYDHKTKDNTDDDDVEWGNMLFEPKHLKTMDPNTGKFAFSNEEGAKVILTREKVKTSDYYECLS